MRDVSFAEEYFSQDDRTSWGVGQWNQEPDKVVWVDEATNLDCMIVRNHYGALCGYVGVSTGHPYFECSDYDVGSEIECHGGLTFSNFCDEDESRCNEKRICHVAQPGREEKIWWLGFDCAHSGDLCPRTHHEWGFGTHAAYRNLDYVVSECQNVAQQLHEVAI